MPKDETPFEKLAGDTLEGAQQWIVNAVMVVCVIAMLVLSLSPFEDQISEMRALRAQILCATLLVCYMIRIRT